MAMLVIALVLALGIPVNIAGSVVPECFEIRREPVSNVFHRTFNVFNHFVVPFRLSVRLELVRDPSRGWIVADATGSISPTVQTVTLHPSQIWGNTVSFVVTHNLVRTESIVTLTVNSVTGEVTYSIHEVAFRGVETGEVEHGVDSH
jgi:hypothetical protein